MHVKHKSLVNTRKDDVSSGLVAFHRIPSMKIEENLSSLICGNPEFEKNTGVHCKCSEEFHET